MKAKIQLELFANNDELTLVQKELEALYIQHEKLKKTLVSRYNHLARLCLSLKEENEELKRRIDKLERQQETGLANPGEDLLERLFKEAYLPQRSQ